MLAPLVVRPLVSVIVPSFNQAHFIRETLDSILRQDYRPLEVLVLDGASTDGTQEILRGFDGHPEVWWQSKPDGGVTSAVNEGLARARGEVLAVQSSDDLYCPGAIGEAVEALARPSIPGLVVGEADYIDAASAVVGRSHSGSFTPAAFLAKCCHVVQSSAFFRRGAAARVGGWCDQISYVADADFWLRLALVAPVQKVDRVWSRYRYHEAQRDKARAHILEDWDRMTVLRRDMLTGVPGLWRAARAGRYTNRLRYAPPAPAWKRTSWALLATCLYPPCWRHLDRQDLVPGLALLRGLRRRVGRLALRRSP